MERLFIGQSYKWPRYSIVCEGEVPDSLVGVSLSKVESGNLTKFFVKPEGPWHGLYVSWSGNIYVSNFSQGEAIIACASSGSWSGGSNYSGYIFGKAGAVVRFARKSFQKWLVFNESGYQWQGISPADVPQPL